GGGGRPFSDPEQYGGLMKQGDPMGVARRYWPERSRSLAIGWELIGPELFPTYAFVLILNVCITLVTVLDALWVYHVPMAIKPFFLPVGIQVVCVTGIIMVLYLVCRECSYTSL